MRVNFIWMRAIIVLLVLNLPLVAFAYEPHSVHRGNNLASYIYGGKEVLPPATKKPLTLPAKVGVMFVPEKDQGFDVPETTKKHAIDAICSQLKSHKKYVAGAFPVPSSYLHPNGGIANLDQVARIFDVDVIIVLAADQFQQQIRNPIAAFMDITLVGMFTIPGNIVDTRTVLEAAVYHVPSRALIFRTDGSDERKSRATNYGSTAVMREDAFTGVEAAANKLMFSLGEALTKFEKFDVATAESIHPLTEIPADKKSSPAPADYWRQVNSYKSGGGGGGALDVMWLVMTGGVTACLLRRS